MNPSFLTSEYVAACADAKYVQAWWRATWNDECPAWALPSTGSGPHCNVCVGDFFNVGPGIRAGLCGPMIGVVTKSILHIGVPKVLPDGAYFSHEVGGDIRGHCFEQSHWALTRGAGRMAWERDYPQTENFHFFLPRLDQLLWLLSVQRCSLEQVATMYALMGAPTHPWERVNSWPLDLLPQADAHLRDIGVPL